MADRCPIGVEMIGIHKFVQTDALNALVEMLGETKLTGVALHTYRIRTNG